MGGLTTSTAATTTVAADIILYEGVTHMGTATTTTATTDPVSMSVFVAPEEPKVVIIDSPWMGLAVPIGVDVEWIDIPIVDDKKSRAEAEKVSARLLELVPFTEEGSDRRERLMEAIDDLANDIGWYDGNTE